MRILLIIPTFNYKGKYPTFVGITDFPVGFAYLASALKTSGHQVFGLNLNNDTNYVNAYEMIYTKINKILKEVKPEMICLGGLCTDFAFIRDALNIIRRLSPDVPVVMGGGIISNDTEFIFQTLHPDFCIIGEGEEILTSLADMLQTGNKSYDKIPNLGYWKDNLPIFTDRDFNYIHIDKRNFPDYEPFGIQEMLNDYSMATRPLYRYINPYPRPMVIVTARSCPFNCTFCVHQRGPKYRARTIENIMEELEYLYEKYYFNILIINDELFIANKKRMKEFCIALIDKQKNLGWKFNWLFQTHPSASLDIENFELAKQAGCYCFSYGLESASPRVLKSMNKQSNPDRIVEAIQISEKLKLGFCGNFIFGDIAETPETVNESIKFFLSYCMDKHVILIYINPYPGSKIFDICMERNIITDKLEFYQNIDEYPFNMTQVPDNIWLPWIIKLCSFTDLSPWIKPAYPLTYTRELERETNPMALHLKKAIYKITLKCPYCAEEIFFRELLNISEENHLFNKKQKSLSKTIEIFKKIQKIFIKITAIYSKEKNFQKFLKRCKMKLISLFSCYILSEHLLFKAIDSIPQEEVYPDSFITGCPVCNRRIRINTGNY